MNLVKVCVAPLPTGLSQAMYRVARALARHAPEGVEIVSRPEDADIQVLHVVDLGSFNHLRCDRHVIIQYCYKSTEPGADPSVWQSYWDKSEMVWSYYDLPVASRTPFYLAPIGVDDVFWSNHHPSVQADRRGILTSGYVSSPEAEAIEEVAIAADRVGIPVIHLGPDVPAPGDWRAVSDISDGELRELYQSVAWVSGLRHVEGFELPALEGLRCGARPILFDRPDMRRWYDGRAVFVPESCNEELVEHLVEVLSQPPIRVSPRESMDVGMEFSWGTIARGFWNCAIGRRGETDLQTDVQREMAV